MGFGNTNKDIFSLTEGTFNYQSAQLASLNYKFNPLFSMITFILQCELSQKFVLKMAGCF